MGSFFLFLLETVILSVPAAALAALILQGGRKKRSAGGEHGGHDYRRMWLLYSLLIFLCWLPIFLAYYPSVFAYDAEGQLYQVIAKDYSTHHPLLHTLFLGAFFRLGGAAGSYQTGMAVHSVVQMLLMAIAFGRALSWLYEKGTPRWVRILLFLFYSLHPANSILALSTTKDVLFAALVLVCTLKGYRFVSECRQGASGAAGKNPTGLAGAGETAVYVILAALMLLFRNNAVYAFAVSVPIVCIGLRKRKKYLDTALLVLVLFGISAFALKSATYAKGGSPREMLSVPLQQMARVRVEAEEKLDPVMRQELDKYIPAEWVFAAYDPHLADPVKNRAIVHDDPAGLVKTWVRLGLQYPTIYVDAFLDNSLGLWYLWDTSHAQVYGIGTESGFGYLSTDNRTMPAGCEIVERSFLPGLRAFMERIVSDNAYLKLPLIRLLFAPALYWWLLWLCLVTALYHKKGREALPAVFLIAYYLTLLLSPTVIVRYMYPLMVTVPVIFPYILMKGANGIQENKQ